jgi:hypothetical protein
MTGRVGVGEADDIAQFYIALLDFFSASEFASESSISLAIASNVRLMKLR